MCYEEYLLYLQGSVAGYSIKMKKHIIKRLKQQGLIRDKDPQLAFDEIGEINVEGLQLEEKLENCLDENAAAVKNVEEWEFIKSYKYSVLFDIKDPQQFESLVSDFTSFNNIDNENDYISVAFTDPIKYIYSNILFLKFNLALFGYNVRDADKMYEKYPVIMVYYPKLNVAEVRFNAIKQKFAPDKYNSIDEKVITGIISYFIVKRIKLIPIDLEYITDFARNGKDVNLKLMMQNAKNPRGGSAKLSVGNNDQYVLPIIGELKELCKLYIMELEKVPKLQEALDQLIYENEEAADYSYIQLKWFYNDGTSLYSVRITFNYGEKNCCLIQHLYNSTWIEMERMTHVTEYIIKNR